MVTRSHIKTLMEHPAGLFELVWRFNVEPACYADISHFKILNLEEEYLNRLKSNPRGSRMISHLLLDKLGILNHAYLDFSQPYQRLALLDRTTILQLIAFAGAAIHSSQIARVLYREERSQLIQQLGEPAYHFGLQRSAFPSTQSDFFDALSLRTQSNVDNPSKERLSLAKQIFNAGQKCIEICLAQEPIGLTERFILKFPTITDPALDQSSTLTLLQMTPTFQFTHGVSHEEQSKIWQFLYRILIRDISPPWKSCFN